MKTVVKPITYEGKSKLTEPIHNRTDKYYPNSPRDSPEARLFQLNANTHVRRKVDPLFTKKKPLHTAISINLSPSPCESEHRNSHPLHTFEALHVVPSAQGDGGGVGVLRTPSRPRNGNPESILQRKHTEKPSQKYVEKTPDRHHTAPNRPHPSVHEYRKAILKLPHTRTAELKPPPPSLHVQKEAIHTIYPTPFTPEKKDDRPHHFRRGTPSTRQNNVEEVLRAHPGEEGAMKRRSPGDVAALEERSPPLPPSAAAKPTEKIHVEFPSQRSVTTQSIGSLPLGVARLQQRAPRSVILCVDPHIKKTPQRPIPPQEKKPNENDHTNEERVEENNTTGAKQKGTSSRSESPSSEGILGGLKQRKAVKGVINKEERLNELLTSWTREKVRHSWMRESFQEICGMPLSPEKDFQREGGGGLITSGRESPTAPHSLPLPPPRETPHSPRSPAVWLANGGLVGESCEFLPPAVIGENLVGFIFRASCSGAVGMKETLNRAEIELKSGFLNVYFETCLQCHMELLQRAWLNVSYIQMVAFRAIEYLEEHSRYLIGSAYELFLLDARSLFLRSKPRRRPQSDAIPRLSATFQINAKPKTNTTFQRIAKWFSSRPKQRAHSTNAPKASFPSVTAKRLTSTEVVFTRRRASSASKTNSEQIRCSFSKGKDRFPKPIFNSVNEFTEIVPPPISKVLTIEKCLVKVSSISNLPGVQIANPHKGKFEVEEFVPIN
ncbi:unnamed protein product [Phytomonas sp. EM1]|nr:unnamed protein product [Phytomonas sp. EM1]|eukprot:CCW62510.1 unnamed protein product [Phytomonas sp. isolate EM1]